MPLSAPEIVDVTEPMAPMMPSLRPFRMDLPDSTSQEPAPAKKPRILSLMPVTVL